MTLAARFLQIHTLTSYPASLLNRDDAGFAKRIPFGGSTRTRISSQCLKRHWRRADDEHALAQLTLAGEPVPMSVRSRHTFERYVLTPLVDEGLDAELAREATLAVLDEVLGKSKKREKASEKAGEEEGAQGKIQTEQVTVLGRPEIEFLLGEARALCAEAASAKDVRAAAKERFKKEAAKNLQALRLGAGLDAALFGRMVTSDILARCDAAVHVAHAFTVHAEAAETDYFSAIDDLQEADAELGSGHINTTELASGLFYGYVVVDLPLLVSNLTGCERRDWLSAESELAGQVLEHLVHLVATISPGAKLGSTAPYASAHLVLLESGKAQPRTLANAFLEPVPIKRGGLVEATYRALGEHLADLDAMYGRSTERQLAALGPRELLGAAIGTTPTDLASLARWAGEVVRSA